MTAPVRVLVMSAGSIPGVGIIRGLRAQSDIPVHITAADMDRVSFGRFLADDDLLVPSAGSPDFIPFVLAQSKERGIGIVFPVIDEELQPFADHQAEFVAAGIQVVSNAAATVRVANDKLATYRLACSSGIPTPRTWAWADRGQVLATDFPVYVKPRDGRGSVGVRRVDSLSEFGALSAQCEGHLIQSAVDGQEYTVDILMDFEGTVHSAIPRKRLQVKSGVCSKAETCRDEELCALATRVAVVFGLAPRANVQFIRPEEGPPQLIEVNPKFGGTSILSTAAGVNLPLQVMRLYLGLGFSPGIHAFEAGLIMARMWDEIYMRKEDPSAMWRLEVP